MYQNDIYRALLFFLEGDFDKKAGERKKGASDHVGVKDEAAAEREPWETCFDHSPF